MATAAVKQNVVCIVIDGWGVSPDPNPRGDAIRNANTPYMDKFEKEYAYTTLGAHGLDVGLPDGLMGNSEVGHLNIGAGRIVYQVCTVQSIQLENFVSGLVFLRTDCRMKRALSFF